MKALVAVLLVAASVCASVADDGPAPLPFRVRTWFFEDVRDLLIPGDSVYAIAVRSAADRQSAATFSEEKFQSALTELAGVQMEGLEKVIVLSSFEDLERVISGLPEDITAVSYNTERGMTPLDELMRLAEYVPRFAELCHQHGRVMRWGPTGHMLTRNPDLLELAAHCDGMGLQHQQILQHEGLEAFVALTRERAGLIHSINPDCRVTVQLVLERTPAEQVIPAFEAVADCVDAVGVWTMQDREGLRRVLEGLRRERLPH
ncbi:MAG: hypothetical protein J7M38_11210 [Armatimonadetes bacterium]|nr:hypothetical protein [Armatimonadota bacterium]